MKTEHEELENHEEKLQSTPNVTSSKTIGILIFIFLFVLMLFSVPTMIDKFNNQKSKTESKGNNPINAIPSVYTENYTLTKGKIFRINIPDGYKCDYYGGGKKYYHQAQNSEKEIWGGGICPTGLGNPNATYADISYYNEEITVVCKFTKKY